MAHSLAVVDCDPQVVVVRMARAHLPGSLLRFHLPARVEASPIRVGKDEARVLGGQMRGGAEEETDE